jgi:hypothetical protein
MMEFAFIIDGRLGKSRPAADLLKKTASPQGQVTLPSPLPVMAFGEVTLTENQ